MHGHIVQAGQFIAPLLMFLLYYGIKLGQFQKNRILGNNFMQKAIVKLAEKKLIGITTRTNNKQLFESDPSTNKVAATVQKYFRNGLAENIVGRKSPGATFC